MCASTFMRLQVIKALGKGSYGVVYKVQRLADGQVRGGCGRQQEGGQEGRIWQQEGDKEGRIWQQEGGKEGQWQMQAVVVGGSRRSLQLAGVQDRKSMLLGLAKQQGRRKGRSDAHGQ